MIKNQEIKLVVCGASNSGKSTLATHLADTLREHGWDVEHDFGVDGKIDITPNRIQYVKEHSKVSIVEMQAARRGVCEEHY